MSVPKPAVTAGTALPVAVAALCLTTIAGCGSSGTSAAPAGSPPATASLAPSATDTAPSTTAPATATARPTASPAAASTATATPPGPALCRLGGLSVSPGSSQGAAGTILATVIFRNTGSRPCILQGYPGVAGLNAAGQQVVQAVRVPQTASPGAVTLAPGNAATAGVSGSDVPRGTQTRCPSYTLLVTPPGETHSIRVALTLPGCAGLRVMPVVPAR